MISTTEAILTVYPSASPITDFRVEFDEHGERVTWVTLTPLTPAQITAIKATAGIDATVSEQQRTVARTAVAARVGAEIRTDPVASLMRTVVLIALDEFNLHALKINAILDAVDAATSLADLKTRIGLIADYPPRTKAQLLNAMTTKITAGNADA